MTSYDRKSTHIIRVTQVKCGICSESFTSRTKLFKHVKDEDHAQPRLQPAKGNATKAKKAKR